jgi:adenylate cyclase
VMEGSVRYAGKRVRITAQLIDVKTGAHLWSEAYDRDLEDIFAIQSDIALKITEAMKVEFSVAEQASISKPLTNSATAYAHYVRALSWLSRPIPDIGAIQRDLDRAIEADPQFAAALALQAYFYAVATTLATEETPRTPESQARDAEQATIYAKRALAVDPNMAGAYLALSFVDNISRDWEASFANVERAYQLNPNQTQIIFDYARRLNQRGKVDEAIVLFDRAIALNPMDINLPLFSGGEMVFNHRWEDAMRYARHVITLVPDAYLPYVQLAAAAAWSGDGEMAIKMAQEAELLAQGSTVPIPHIVLLDVYTRFGMEGDAARILAKLHEIDRTRGLNDGQWATLYAVVGDADKAFEHMNAMIDNNFPIGGIVGLAYTPQNNLWDNIRDDPRFEAARQKIGLPE